MSLLSEEQFDELAKLDAGEVNEASEEAPAEAEAEEAPQTEEGATDEVKTEESAQSEKVEYEEEVPTTEETSEEETEKDTKPLELSDDAIVIDPATGEEVKWGDIKNQRLMQADYTRKTQEVAEQRRLAEQVLADKQEKKEEVPEQEDPYSDLDPDDPMVQMMKAKDAQLQALMQRTEQLGETLESERNVRQQADLERTENQMMEKYPVLDSEELDVAGMKYLIAMNKGESITYDQVVKAHADKLMKREEGSIKAWKEKHRKQPAAERQGAVVSSPPKDAPTGADLMKGNIADLIAKEDAELARQTNR